MHAPTRYVMLGDRAVLAIEGADAERFLQGLVSCDVRKVTHAHARLGALLSPQGKFLFDFFLLRTDEGFLLDTEAARVEALIKKLSLYRLRADVTVRRCADLAVASLFDAGQGSLSGNGGVRTVPDPRHPGMGVRLYGTLEAIRICLATLGAREAAQEFYEERRLSLSLPEGTKDAVAERTLLLENGYDALGGVDFDKGCYVGQEVTARSHHRGELRKFLHRVESDAALPPAGVELLAGGKPIGEMRSSSGARGLALVRADLLATAQQAGEEVMADGCPVTVTPPWWYARG